MIQANHKKWAEFIFEKYLNSILKKSFKSLNLMGEIPDVKDDKQLIILPNHSTWWDGFFVWYLNRIIFRRKFYLMMLESRLEKYNFFTKLGAFSINQTNPKSILETFSYINKILQSDERILLNYYPQGELLPNFIRPIKINPGIIKIIKNYPSELIVLPLGIRIEFLVERFPFVFFNFGEPIEINNEESNLINNIQNSIEKCLEEIELNILKKRLGKVIFEGKKSQT
ncbi:MAG: lysophospholipid acyltransferase family protein [Candidatus Kapabacteria bacterium]|nr:lysophospholipid acyltransferase family protein [Candidatus Kapabacteria bacterium]